MATKNCPKCSSQVPVACKKCSCGHCFFTTRKGSGTSGSGPSSSGGATSSKQVAAAVVPESPIALRDRVPRERGRPVFYDAQELDAQMKKQKQLMKQQSKSHSSKSESSKVPTSSKNAPSTENENAPTTEEEPTSHHSDGGTDEQTEPKKRKRGRPPGITAKKGRLSNPRIPIAINNSSRILPNRKPANNTTATNNNSLNVNNNNVDGKNGTEEAEDIMSDLSPEKALQLNIVLNEINRKWASANWKG